MTLTCMCRSGIHKHPWSNWLIEGSVSSFNSCPMVSYQSADGGTGPRIKFGLMFGLKLLLEYSDIEDFALVLVGFWLISSLDHWFPFIFKAAVCCDANDIL